MRLIRVLLTLLLPAILLAACGKSPTRSTTPATAEPVVQQSELLKPALSGDVQR
jgi:uncharacterized lipoprotein YbaY